MASKNYMKNPPKIPMPLVIGGVAAVGTYFLYSRYQKNAATSKDKDKSSSRLMNDAKDFNKVVSDTAKDTANGVRRTIDEKK
jgi:hypothetical protein